MFDNPERRIVKRQYTSFISGIPSWLMGIGSASVTHDKSRGRMNITVDNGVGGVSLTCDKGRSQQKLSTADFAELRLGCSFSHDLSGSNNFNISLTDSTGTSVSSAWVSVGEASNGNNTELLLAEGGTQTVRILNNKWVGAGGGGCAL